MSKALESNPRDATAHFYLGLVLEEQGKLEEAREEYRACLRHDPIPEMAGYARRTIAKINEEKGQGGPSASSQPNVR